MWRTRVGDEGHNLNTFDYKILQFSQTEITIYHINQNDDIFDTNSLNPSNYLSALKYQQVDLPCNDYFYVCRLGEFIKTYSRRLKELDFSIDKQIDHTLSEETAKESCIIITIGLFRSI